MRVKLREISAESAEQQSPGWRSRSGRNPGAAYKAYKPCKGGAVCIALTGLLLNPIRNPGFQSPLRVLFHPGLCCSALSALPVSLTRMPYETLFAVMASVPALRAGLLSRRPVRDAPGVNQ